jgi:hypothetical protein
MTLSLHNVSSFIQQDIVTIYQRGNPIEHRLRGQINFIKKNPLTILDTLDKCSFDELEDEAPTTLQFVGPLMDLQNLSLEMTESLCHLQLLLPLDGCYSMIEAMKELFDPVFLITFLG